MNSTPTAQKIRRHTLLKTAGGFALLTVGVPLLFLPGPGAPAIVLGLTLLRGEYLWASRALSRLEGPAQWLRTSWRPSRLWAAARLGLQRRVAAAPTVGGDSEKLP